MLYAADSLFAASLKLFTMLAAATLDRETRTGRLHACTKQSAADFTRGSLMCQADASIAGTQQLHHRDIQPSNSHSITQRNNTSDAGGASRPAGMVLLLQQAAGFLSFACAAYVQVMNQQHDMA